MCRILGFLLFWIGIGILIGMLLPNPFLCVLAVAVLLLLGYNLFCS